LSKICAAIARARYSCACVHGGTATWVSDRNTWDIATGARGNLNAFLSESTILARREGNEVRPLASASPEAGRKACQTGTYVKCEFSRVNFAFRGILILQMDNKVHDH
jgi:hypothetical protein